MKALYFDYAASTPLHPDVLKEMLPFLSSHFGNPSSIHSYGRKARGGIEKSRENLASVLGAEAVEIIFTSGGTEADNLAVIGSARAIRDTGRHIITSEIEHPAVLKSCQFLEQEGFTVTYLPVDSDGLIDPESLKKAIRKDTILISLMHVNNEIGVIEPVEELCKIALEAQIPFHSDGVQSFGYIDVNIDTLPVDMYSVSAHKIYGPGGVGALYIKRGTKISPLIYGGEQENQKRAGTENTAAIVGMGEAAKLLWREREKRSKKVKLLGKKLIEGILSLIDGARLMGHPERRIPGIYTFLFPGVEGDSLLLNLDLTGVAASSGSACSSHAIEPSHVLMALGLNAIEAGSCIRFSIGEFTSEVEIDKLLEILPPLVKKLRR